MKQGDYSSLQAFAAELERRAAAKEDLVAPTDKCALVPVVREGRGDIDMVIGGNRTYQINEIGHEQIAETAKIPADYYRRMRAEQPELLASNVNTWFVANPQKRMIRTLDGKVRAVRSDSFRADLEYEHLTMAVLPVLQELDVAIMSFQITERRFYLKVVDKKVERELAAIGGKFGDGKHNIVRCLSPSATISDSEVGYGSANVTGGVYDSFCSNLASFGERSVRKYHVGKKHELAAGVDYALLSDDTKQKTAAATIAQIKDVVRAIFDRAKFDELCQKIEATQDEKIDKDADVVKVVKAAGDRLGLTQDEGKGVLRHLIEGGDLSKFGLYNAVTRFSQDLADYDRASKLELVGAQVIDLPKTDWKRIACAA